MLDLTLEATKTIYRAAVDAQALDIEGDALSLIHI